MNLKKTNTLIKLLHHPAAPGILLMGATVAALIVANFEETWYDRLLDTEVAIGIGTWMLEKPLLLFINDGLMAVFFLLVGLELKREVLYGELSERRKAMLPLVAAIGGIAIPSLIYVVVNWGDARALNGWAIPAATDIAFALGVLAILGSRVPVVLKIFLASVAVFDDLAAIVIIAVFYTNQLSLFSLGTAAFVLGALFGLNRGGVRTAAPYVILGTVLWLAVLKSGVHATLAGVALAAVIPAERPRGEEAPSLLSRMEHGLHPWVMFGILPVFAFANAGVPLKGLEFSDLLAPVPLGIALGLFLGKPVGIVAASWLAVRCRIAQLPAGVRWVHVCGVSMLCGIGFTMSLFIGSLAFEAQGGTGYAMDDRLGILSGSLLSALSGMAVLVLAHRFAAAAKPAVPDDELVVTEEEGCGSAI